MGEQGTAKSTTCRVLRQLVDPNHADVRSEPRDARDLAVSADNGHLIAMDNISRLPEWLSDALCRLATGGGFSTRTLYENREEEIFEAQRPVILNGIAQVATRPDLIDRAIVLTLPQITERNRRNESDFWNAFNTAKPRLLGALLDATVVGLRNYRDVRFETLPRMADFATWGVAVEPACPWEAGTFMTAFKANRRSSTESVLDGDALGDAVRAITPWSGTARDLLSALNRRTSQVITGRRDWFTSHRQMADHLRRLTPGLRVVGVEVTYRREPGTGRRLIDIQQAFGPSSPSSRSSRELEVARAAKEPVLPHSVSSKTEQLMCDEGDEHDVPLWPS